MVGGLPVCVCAHPVNFRLGIDGLSLRVQASLGPQRALASAHVFFNRGRDKVKILWYDPSEANWVVADVQAPGAWSVLDGFCRRSDNGHPQIRIFLQVIGHFSG